MIFSESERAIRKGFQPSRKPAHIAGQLAPKYRQCPPATCRVVARRAKPEADRLFSLADLCIGKRKLSVLGALSEAGGLSLSLVTLATISKILSAMRITL